MVSKRSRTSSRGRQNAEHWSLSEQSVAEGRHQSSSSRSKTSSRVIAGVAEENEVGRAEREEIQHGGIYFGPAAGKSLVVASLWMTSLRLPDCW